MAIEPPPCPWRFPDPESADEIGFLGLGGDTEPGTLLAAYRSGIFPMPIEPGEPMGWWSPDPRGVLELDRLRVSRSLRRSIRRYEIRVDSDFDGVIEGCGNPNREHGWIDHQIVAAYRRLFELGWVHTVEAWDGDELVGGLYGVAIGGVFAGESMFHRRTDASKVALVALVDMLDDGHRRLIDVQWPTDHLATLGVTAWPRSRYLAALAQLIEVPAATFCAPGALA